MIHIYLFWFWYFFVLGLVNITLFVLVTIKVCRTTRSVFALTLLSFTLILALALIYWSFVLSDAISVFSEPLFASVPIQSWLFAMQYLKSYLYTCASADSPKYKIHTIIKYSVIVAYAAALIYFRCWLQKTYAKYEYQHFYCTYVLYD